jgi:hypothetical protein
MVFTIPRKDYCITKNTVVCAKQFAAAFIVTADIVTRSDGCVISEPQKRPKLTADAYPSIFPRMPSYLTSEPTRKRKAREYRRLALAVRDEKMLTDWMSDDKISTFDDFCSKASDFVKGSTDVEWLVIVVVSFCVFQQ